VSSLPLSAALLSVVVIAIATVVSLSTLLWRGSFPALRTFAGTFGGLGLALAAALFFRSTEQA
jgi:hypothetical protein